MVPCLETDPEGAGLVCDLERSIPNDAVAIRESEVCAHVYNQSEGDSRPSEHGSSVTQATFNFTNSIIGAGAIGLGGAMAVSGGLISVLLIVFFGFLTKLSLDMVIRLSVENFGTQGTYEDLAHICMGRQGRSLVMVCKLLYSFGCLVAYIVVIKDNIAPAIRDLLYGPTDHHHRTDWFHSILADDEAFTWLISTLFILPLCLLRDMTPLASLSLFSVASMIAIVAIVISMYFFCPEIAVSGGSFYTKWIEVRAGVLESLGTFVFTFVSQHTVHLVFGSLKPSLRTVEKWNIVSSWSLFSATTVSLSVGLFVYMTFWQDTKSDIFDIYPKGLMVDYCKLLLCVTMILTFPLPFFTCRELCIVTFIHPFCGIKYNARSPLFDERLENDLHEPLIESTVLRADGQQGSNDVVSIVPDTSRRILSTASPKHWLLPSDQHQLKFVGHVGLTVKLWIVATSLAIAAPSLGHVLNLVGCATGTIIAFLLPALFSFRIEGYSHVAMIIFLVGAIVGPVGTYFSLKTFF